MKNLLMYFKGGSANPLVAPGKGVPASDLSGKTETGKPSASEKRGESNPYVEARREWNERYGDYMSQARNWRYMAFLAGLVAMIAVAGVGYMGAQNKIVPYVVQVDKFGAAIATGPAERVAPVDQKVLKAYLARFISDWRSVIVDRTAQKDAIVRIFSMLPLTAASTKKMNEYMRDNNPFNRMQSIMVSVEFTSALPISDKTWQVEWTETLRNTTGEVKAKVRMKASLVIAITPPTDEQQILVNPLGVFITDFNVAQQL